MIGFTLVWLFCQFSFVLIPPSVLFDAPAATLPPLVRTFCRARSKNIRFVNHVGWLQIYFSCWHPKVFLSLKPTFYQFSWSLLVRDSRCSVHRNIILNYLNLTVRQIVAGDPWGLIVFVGKHRVTEIVIVVNSVLLVAVFSKCLIDYH